MPLCFHNVFKTLPVGENKRRFITMRYTIIFILCISLLVYAFGNNVSVAQQEVDKSKRWALIIGISQYERKDDINSLRFAVQDATSIRDALIDQ